MQGSEQVTCGFGVFLNRSFYSPLLCNQNKPLVMPNGQVLTKLWSKNNVEKNSSKCGLHIIPSSFPPTQQEKTCRLNACKTLCNSSTHFEYFNSWQKVDGETFIVKFGHHSRTYLEGLTKFWSIWGSSAPLYSPFCTLRIHTFGPKPFLNPTHFHLKLNQIISGKL